MQKFVQSARWRDIYRQMGLEGKRAVIIHHDDLGTTHAATLAYEALGLPTGSLMMPTTWASAFAGRQDADLGVHLTLTSEWQTPRWRPLSNGVSLRDGQGCFWRSSEDCWMNVDAGEVEAEFRAQIEAALRLGIDITHIDTHMGTALRPDLARIYAQLAIEYGVPAFIAANLDELEWIPAGVRAAHRAFMEQSPLPAFRTADSYGVDSPESCRSWWLDKLSTLAPGVYHLLHHAALPTEEGQMLPDWRVRAADFHALSDPEVRRLLREECILLTYRQVRQALRQTLG
jgi:predicted glycoside hydrolase/deacetylase ChbG (UPF0249 family)